MDPYIYNVMMHVYFNGEFVVETPTTEKLGGGPSKTLSSLELFLVIHLSREQASPFSAFLIEAPGS